jgi:hypothetical protein
MLHKKRKIYLNCHHHIWQRDHNRKITRLLRKKLDKKLIGYILVLNGQFYFQE